MNQNEKTKTEWKNIFNICKRQMVNIHNITAALQIIKKSDTQLRKMHKAMNKQFIEEILMANKHMKSSSFLLVFRKNEKRNKNRGLFFP